MLGRFFMREQLLQETRVGVESGPLCVGGGFVCLINN